MKSIRRHASTFSATLALMGLLFLVVPKLSAQQDFNGDADDTFNPPPCDYNDTFYMDNGVDPIQVQGRFGSARQFGPPARTANQPNWVADSSCVKKDPVRRNVRILATTGGYIDDESGNATDFISLIGFLTSQNAFETTYSRTVGEIPAGGGNTISIVNSQTPRGIALQDIVSNFEAYPALKQKLASGVLAPTPCGSLFDPNIPTNSPCFSVASAATPNLRQDWRFASNRNAIDGSDNNCINNDPTVCAAISDSPFGYFCDDLLGIWINTYFWFTHHAVGNRANSNEAPDPLCTSMMKQLISMHGRNLDGTGVIITGNELNFLEGKDVGTTPLGPNFPNPPLFSDGEGCAAEGQLDTGGADAPGAVWDICPTIPDPRAGAISPDAFLDSVTFSSGLPVDIRFNINFACLQTFGQFCNINVSLQNAGINPNPTKVGTQTNIVTLFQNTTNTSMSGVTLTANVVNSSGSIVATKSLSGTTLGPGQTSNVTIVWAPTASGTYTVQGTAKNADDSGIGLNPIVGLVTVN